MESVDRITQLPAPPARPADSHKGTYGRVLIVAGSRGMSGAACLAGLGALRGGAGLVSVAVPDAILATVAAVEPSYLTIPLTSDADGRLSAAAWDRLQQVLPSQSAVAIGPGWGQSDELTELARRLYSETGGPLVIDADGLNALAKMPEVLAARPANGGAPAPRILTPHPGEFSRLAVGRIGNPSYSGNGGGATAGRIANSSHGESQGSREQLAVDFARAHEIVLVLKGHRTLVTDGERLYENTTGNPGMATGGTGDVLTGLVTALAAQGLEAFEAAQLGVYLHGLAGDLAAKDLSQPGLIASDLPRYLAAAWVEYLRNCGAG